MQRNRCAADSGRAEAPLQSMSFALSELREARLAPIVDFKGRKARAGAPSPGPIAKELGA